jgi:hypothetical protein
MCIIVGDVGVFSLSDLRFCHHDLVGAPGWLPRELRCPVLVRTTDWWAKASLLKRVALLASGNRSFAALGLPCTTSCTVYDWPPLCLLV